MKIKYIILSLVLMLIFSFNLACEKQNEKSELGELVKNSEVIDELKEELTTGTNNATETITETPTEELVDIDKVKFWEAIINGEKSYDLTDKLLEYPFEELNILSEFLNGEITYDEQITRFWQLANKVQDDFFIAEIVIKGRLKDKGIELNEEMEHIINLISEWAEKMGDRYSYYAKYLETDQAEYDFKVEELKDETELIYDEYSELTKSYRIAYMDYYNIEYE